MRVSVITVCFNANAVIQACLESVAEQVYPDLEHIVIDGGSTDGTLKTVQCYPHVGDWVSEPNSGIYHAMNKGVARATGDLLLFLNADDRFPTPESLKAAMLEVASGPDADVYYGSLEVRNREGGTHIFHPPAPEDAADFMVCGCLPHQATLARKWVFERTKGFDENYRIHADYDWYLKVLADPAVRVRRIGSVVGSYYSGGSSAKLSEGQPEVFQIQNNCNLYKSPEWDKKRITIYQEYVLNLRIQNECMEGEMRQKDKELRNLQRRTGKNLIARIAARYSR